MLSFNLTLVMELTLFLCFYAISRRLFFVPLHRLVRERRARIQHDEAAARSDEEEVQRLNRQHEERVVQAQQEAGRRLREARFNAYAGNRAEMDKRRQHAEADVAAFRTQVQLQIEREREKYPQMLPALVKSMDRQLDAEGSLF